MDNSQTKPGTDAKQPDRGRFPITDDGALAEGLPAELKAAPQWVAWQRTPPKKSGGKLGKVPINPHTGRRASTTNSSTWGSYEQAVTRARYDGLAGVGFVFAADGDLVGVDLDGCRDPATGQLDDEAAALVARLDSYTEVSPSGTGVHVLVRGQLPPGRRRKGKVEMYDRERFFTVTGQQLPETPAGTEERTTVLAEIHAETFGPPPTEPDPSPPASSAPIASLTDDELLSKAGAAANGRKFEALWGGDTTGYDSPSEADAALCCMLAFWTGKDAGRIDKLFRQSGLMRAKWDEKHGIDTYGARTIVSAISCTEEVYTGQAGPPASGGEGESLATVLVGLVRNSGTELFHDADSDPYAGIPHDGHVEVLRLRDKVFSRWLAGLAYRELGKAVGAAAQADAQRALEAAATFDGRQQDVHVRIAACDDGIVVDRGDAAWSAIVVTASGWRLVDRPPVAFRRPRGMLELPAPARGTSLAALHPFLNCHDGDLPLLLAWLAAALRPSGPYPVLALIGEQGSAKSTTARVLRSLVDPNKAPLRNLSRCDRDLMISATSSWVLAFDNVSQIPAWLSDALCCVVTGSGFSSRELYSDDAETILTACRPIVLTGIEDFVSRSDLLDRALICRAPIIESSRRRDEETFWREFEAVRAGIFGSLLGAVACGLRRLPGVRLTELPRMADFARWATACEPGLGLQHGDVVRALRRSADEAVQVALEASPIARAIQALVEERGPTEMPATELLARLNERRGAQPEPHGWPKAPNALSGMLKRVAPNLRARGIAVELDARPRSAHSPRRIRLSKVGQETVHIVHTVQPEPEGAIPPQERPPGEWTIPWTIGEGHTEGSSTAPPGPEGPIGRRVDDVDGVDDPPAAFSAGEAAA